MTTTLPPAIPDHAGPSDRAARKGLGPRVRRLHARIGAAHHQAEGMAFSRSLLRALVPAYRLIEALRQDVASQVVLPATPSSPAARDWLLHLQSLARQAPHRFLAHVYVR